ncbi:MAG: hypothetical protein R3E66_09785 [bacterium]
MEDTTKQKNRLWPLYVLGLSLTAFGFYFAFYQSDPPKPTATAKVEGVGAGIDAVPKDLRRSDPQQFEIKASPRRAKIWLEQSQDSREGGSVDTQLRFTMIDTPAGGLTFERTYADVSIESQSDSKPLGAEIPDHVAELIETVKHRITLQSNGQVEGYELVSSQSGQLAPLLAMLKDAMQMMSPQFPREPVNVDEPWSYRAPYDLSAEDGSVTAQGDYQVSSTYRGVTTLNGADVAVVEQNIAGRAAGAFVSGESKMKFTTNGVGHAVFYVDVALGQVVKVGLVYEQVTSLGDKSGVQSTSRLTLEPAP